MSKSILYTLRGAADKVGCKKGEVGRGLQLSLSLPWRALLGDGVSVALTRLVLSKCLRFSVVDVVECSGFGSL